MLPDKSILSGQKFIKNAKNANFASFWKSEVYGQTVLPDRSILLKQKLLENAKIEIFKCDILSDFQTLWRTWGLPGWPSASPHRN